MEKMLYIKHLLLTLLVFSLVSCASVQTVNRKSSVVNYLYPSSEEIVEPSIPHLRLPLRVGIAFVPDTVPTHVFNEAKKHALLTRVADSFRDLEFVKSIELIPSAYLRPQGSFTNLSQIKTMYGVDVIALVSYDQVQFTDEGFLSLSYWTIIGAYIVAGEKNDTNTLIDTVVYDIESRKLLFRAPGTSLVRGMATPVNLSEELRDDSLKGFDLATEEMITNLKLELQRFKDRVKEAPEEVQISYKPNYSGGGAFGPLSGVIALLAVLMIYRRKSVTNNRGEL